MRSLFRRRSPGRPPYPGLLTPAELRVLEEVRRGRTNPEIAEALGLSRATVKYHLVNIYSKTGVSDREAAAQLDTAALESHTAEPSTPGRKALAAWLGRTPLAAPPGRIAAIAVLVGLPAIAAIVFLAWARPPGRDEEPPSSITPTATIAVSWQDLRRRPTLFSRLPDGAGCPVTPVHPYDVGRYEMAAGAGPLALAGRETQSFSLGTGTGANHLGVGKALWVADGGVVPNALLRGGRLDGDSLLTFGIPESATRLRITQSSAPRDPRSDGNPRTDVVIRKGGCYAIQADAADGSAVFVFYGVVRPFMPAPPEVQTVSLGSGAAIAVGTGEYPGLYLANVEDRAVVPVGDSGDLVSSSRDARWSPDGARIAWSTSEGVAIAAAETPAVWTTVGPGGAIGAPAWSADGAQVASARYGDPRQGPTAIVSIDPDSGSSQALTDGTAFDWQPAWSPDGTSVAFVRGQGTAADVYVVDVESRAVTRITTGMAATAPAWSPDGRMIAFESRIGRRESVWVVAADGTDAHEVSTGLAAALQPAWSPDGSALVFSGSAVLADGVAWPGTAYDLYRVEADGSGLAPITSDAASEWAPEWLASGIIRYLSSATGPSEVWELNLETGEKARLTETSGGGVAEFDSRP